MATHAITENPFGDNIVAVYQRKTTLNNAQIKALPTAAIEVVPAPGAGKVILPTHLVLQLTGPGYNVNDAAPITYDRAFIRYGLSSEIMSIVNTAGQSPFQSLLNSSGQLWRIPVSSDIVFDSDWNDNVPRAGLSLEFCENQNVVFGMSTTGGDLTMILAEGETEADYNPALGITVFYSIIDL